MSKVRYKARNAARRRAKATKLAEARAKRTATQQMAKLDAGGHTAQKERARLNREA